MDRFLSTPCAILYETSQHFHHLYHFVMNYSLLIPNLVAVYAKLNEIQKLRWPNWLTFHFHTTSQFRILNSKFRIPKFALRILEFGIRICEVYVVWASGNS